MTIKIQALPAFADNYIWLLTNTLTRSAICVDPGDAEVVLAALREQQLTLTAILVTHHHWDHTDGITALLKHYKADVYCSRNSNMAACTYALVNHDTISLPTLGIQASIIETPGHTLDHICYYSEDMLFCGDTLFAAGCGKVFEGTAEQMYASLSALAKLPEETKIYCGHEYTLANLQFALHLEPNNLVIVNRLQETQLLRQQHQITLPSTLQIEKQTNPFLRCHLPSIKKAASEYCGQILTDPVETFSAIRAWKNSFSG
jgi:hydroxyacylglutathione hydrolase